MRFLIAAWYEFLKNIRDLKMIAIMIVFPIITIYLLGTAVAGFFKDDISPKFTIAYINQDNGMIGSAFDQFLQTQDIQKRLDIQVYHTSEQAKASVDNGECAAMIHLPENLTNNIANGQKQQIAIYGKEDIAFVETLVSGYVSAYNSANALAATGGQLLETERTDSVVRAFRTRNNMVPSIKDYYAILVFLQILVAGGIFGASITSRNHGSDIHIRVHSLPVNRWVLLCGRIFGSVLYLCLTSAFIIAFTAVAYGTEWGGNPLIISGTVLLFNIIMVGMGALCGRIFAKLSTALMAVMVLLFFFGMASGSVSPVSNINSLGVITPNYYAKILLFGSIYGYSNQIMIHSALWLAGFAIATYGLLAVLLRREQRNGNI